MRFRLRYFVLLLAALIILSSMTAIAATNTIPSTQVEDTSITFQIAHLRPSACAGLSLTNLVTGSGALTGTEGNDLILGSTGADTINGAGGNDCILGGGGDDMITGGDGNDVCLGGDGNDIFSECEGELQ
jgi:Ca2+-binding RTX toxin-like protein